MMSDPVEDIIASGLDAADIAYVRDGDTRANTLGLDFLLTESGVFIEVKRFHADRIAAQMARAPNVIAIQGIEAARWFAKAISPPSSPTQEAA